MITVPEIKTKIANETLAPYFKRIEDDIRGCKDNTARKEKLQKYRVYIEGQARKTKSIGVRMQLRINMRALQERFDMNAGPSEVNVFPKKSLGVPVGNRLRLARLF